LPANLPARYASAPLGLTMQYRTYDSARDRDDSLRVYREVGWADGEGGAEAHDLWAAAGRTLVAEVDGRAECVVSNVDGRMRYLDEELELCIVGGVATGRVARQRKLATRLTAEAVAADVIQKGARMSILGMFEQGFYDRLGFGSGSVFHMVGFDPATLDVDVEPRVPIRITVDDYERVHANRAARRLGHGAVQVDDAGWTRADMLISKDGFGLGYADPDTGALTHHLWCGVESVGGGPYFVKWLAYRDRDQFLELMGLLKGLAEQVHLVRMEEPRGIQLQDLLKKPFHRRRVSFRTSLQTGIRAVAWWQARICDLAGCLERTRLPSAESVTFHLRLTDPIAEHLEDETRRRWAGVAGDYVVTLGPESHAERTDAATDLPTLATSVNTFSRMWLGVRPPTGLAYTVRDMNAPRDLLERLDHVLTVPAPHADWDF
jgi:hypothetical protein